MRVLVVEDERKTASFIRKALQAENFAVEVTPNGDDALTGATWADSRTTSSWWRNAIRVATIA